MVDNLFIFSAKFLRMSLESQEGEKRDSRGFLASSFRLVTFCFLFRDFSNDLELWFLFFCFFFFSARSMKRIGILTGQSNVLFQIEVSLWLNHILPSSVCFLLFPISCCSFKAAVIGLFFSAWLYISHFASSLIRLCLFGSLL